MEKGFYQSTPAAGAAVLVNREECALVIIDVQEKLLPARQCL